jgi:oligopeptide transport system permease protein
MAEQHLSADAFAPLHETHEIQSISRPSLSYWQDAWLRLRANRRAIFSLYLIVGLILFTFLGPVVWQVDPAQQDVDQISQSPFADRTVVLVQEYEPWYGVDDGVSGLRFVGDPTTQHVRLQWDDREDVSGFRVYRSLFRPGAEGALGLPLFETPSGQTYFEDRLDLRTDQYFYSIVPLDREGREIDSVETIAGRVIRVIGPSEARELGFLEANETPVYGTRYELALHPLGTDYLGRDMLARLMHGARVSLFIGFFAPMLYVLVGVVYGSAAGFVGGALDQLFMRFADFVVALPFLLFMILFKIIFGIGPGESGIFPMLIAMVLLLWPATARLVRGQILQIREEGYISASRLLGAKTNYLVLRHMIPNTMGVILVTITFAVPSAIFTEAFLSFIGMGVAPPTPSWGSMCNEGIKTMLTHPHELVFPALLISITVLAFNLLGDGLRDALDARMRSQE